MIANVEIIGKVGVFTVASGHPIDSTLLLSELSDFLEEIKKAAGLLVALIHIDGRQGSSDAESICETDNSNRRARSMQYPLSDFPKPVISIARGNPNQDLSELAISADLCFASDDSIFRFSSEFIESIKDNEHPDLFAATQELTFFGSASSDKLVAPADLVKHGIINFALADSDVQAAAQGLATAVSTNAPLALRACKKAVNSGYPLSLSNGLKIETEEFARIFGTRDMKEGTSAFLEKRTPVFTGN